MPNIDINFRVGTEIASTIVTAELGGGGGGLVWPPDPMPPAPTTNNAFDILLKNADNADRWWNATYHRELPYTPNTGWADGERAGYKCAYMFLLWDGVPVGRTTFTRVDGANYAMINDNGMLESQRHFDGSLPPPPVQQAECPPPTQAYEPNTDPDERPIIGFIGPNDQILEIRNYTNTVIITPGVNLRFKVAENTPNRVTVVAYIDDLPAIVVYYDSIVPGVRMVSNIG